MCLTSIPSDRAPHVNKDGSEIPVPATENERGRQAERWPVPVSFDRLAAFAERPSDTVFILTFQVSPATPYTVSSRWKTFSVEPSFPASGGVLIIEPSSPSTVN